MNPNTVENIGIIALSALTAFASLLAFIHLHIMPAVRDLVRDVQDLRVARAVDGQQILQNTIRLNGQSAKIDNLQKAEIPAGLTAAFFGPVAPPDPAPVPVLLAVPVVAVEVPSAPLESPPVAVLHADDLEPAPPAPVVGTDAKPFQAQDYGTPTPDDPATSAARALALTSQGV